MNTRTEKSLDHISHTMESSLENVVFVKIRQLKTTYQKLLDDVTPYTKQRWAAFGVLLALFLLRVVLAQGWYIICYALGIYLLNMFLAFLTPKFDPSLEQEMRLELIEEGVDEGSSEDPEFRPFIRRLPEFKFWYNAFRGVVVSLVLSFFAITDVPVFWPILLMYFIILFVFTMRKQIQHMVKYKYLPFDVGKTSYRSKPSQ